MTTQPIDPTKKLIEETKDYISNVLDMLNGDMSYSARQITDHLIEELVVKLKVAPPTAQQILEARHEAAIDKMDAAYRRQNHAEIKQALQDAVDSTMRYIDERGI